MFKLGVYSQRHFIEELLGLVVNMVLLLASLLALGLMQKADAAPSSGVAPFSDASVRLLLLREDLLDEYWGRGGTGEAGWTGFVLAAPAWRDVAAARWRGPW